MIHVPPNILLVILNQLILPTILGMLKIFYRKHKRDKEDVQLSTIFGFSTISNATNRFSDDNKIGQGGFGPVYKVVKFIQRSLG